MYPKRVTERRLFDVPTSEVVEGVACTWCGAQVGEACVDFKWFALHPAEHGTDSQRWRDYWNATHHPAEMTPVYPAPWFDKAYPA